MIFTLGLAAGFVAGWLVPASFKTWVLGAGRAARVGVRSPAPTAPVSIQRRSIAGMFAPFGLPWKLIACVAVVVVVLGAIHFFGKAQYARGVSDERARVAEATLEVQQESNQASHEEGERFRNDVRDIADELERGNAALENVPYETSDADFLRTWRDLDRSLFDAGSATG